MNARFARSPCQLVQDTIGPVGGIGQTDTRREVIFWSRCNPRGDRLTVRQVIAGHEITERRTGEGLRFHPGNERGGLMMHLRPGSYVVPAYAIVQREIVSNTPAVFRKQTAIGRTFVKRRGGLLRIEIGQSQQEVGESVSGGLGTRTEKRKRPVRNQIGQLFDLVPDVLSADFQRVIPGDLRKVIGNLVGIVDLSEKERIRPHGERIEIESLNTGILRESLLNALRTARDSLVCQTDSDTTLRNTKSVVQARIAEVGLVDHARAKSLRVTQDDNLICAVRECVVGAGGAGNGGTAEADRIRVVEVVAVDEVVRGQGPVLRSVSIDSDRALVVVRPLFLRARRELIAPNVGGRNELQHLRCRKAESLLRNDRVGKHTLSIRSAAGCVERLAVIHLISQTTGKSLGQRRSIYLASQRTGRIREVSAAVQERRHTHEAGLDSFRRALPLIVPEEKYFAFLDGPAKRCPVLVLPKGRALRRKVASSVQIRIAKEFKCRSVKLVSTGFGYDINQSAAVATVFGVSVAADDSELSDGIQIRNDAGLLPNRLLNAGSIQKKAVGRFALAIDGELAGVLVARHWHGSEPSAGTAVRSAAGGDRRHSCLHGQKVGVATAVQRHFRHMLAANGLADLGIGHLNRDNAVVDVDSLRVLPNLQGGVDLQCTVYVNHDPHLLIWLEAWRIDLKFVFANWHDWERILPLVVGGCCLLGSVAHVAEIDSGASDECATRIADYPRDSSCHIGPSGVEEEPKHNHSA